METGLPTRYKTISDKKDYIPDNYNMRLENTELDPYDRDDESTLKYAGSQYGNKNKNIKSKLLLAFDILLIGFYFTAIGYLFSWFINKYTVGDLTIDKKNSGGGTPTAPYTIKDRRINVMSELMLECAVIIIAVFAASQIVFRLPTLIKKPPIFHKNYRVFSGAIILVYTLMSLQIDMRKKAAYVFSSENFQKELEVQQLLDCIQRLDALSTFADFRTCIIRIFPS